MSRVISVSNVFQDAQFAQVKTLALYADKILSYTQMASVFVMMDTFIQLTQISASNAVKLV